MAETYQCMICFDEYNGAPHKTVHGLDLCADCVKESVVPLFYKALKYECHFPPKLGENNILNPRDFLEFFDNKENFLDQWRLKQQEYLTPYKMRLYCSDCSDFLLSKRKDAKPKNVVCDDCLAFTCAVCRANTTIEAGWHVCRPEALAAEDPAKRMEGLERGKDYQLCPNEQCLAVVQLMDGCNHIVCEGCRTNFCWLCGQEAPPDSGHWNFGRPCPRYNRADNNPLYDEGEEEEEQEEEQEEGGEEEEEQEEQEEVRQIIDDLPDLPDLTSMTVEQQLAAERAMLPQLNATPLGQLRLQHRREVQHMLAQLQRQHRIHEANYANVSRNDYFWSMVAVDKMEVLLLHLDVYIYRVYARHKGDEFDNEQVFEDLADNRAVQATLSRHAPRLFEIVHFYQLVVEHRVRRADREGELGERNERAVLRARLALREREMEQDRLFPEWEKVFAERTELNERQRGLARRWRELNERWRQSDGWERELAERGVELMERGRELTEQERELTEQERELTDREREWNLREREMIQRRTALDEQERARAAEVTE